MLSLYALTWLGVLAAQISPGPNLAAVASVALAQGRRPAFFVVSGISSGMLIWSVATGLGLGTLIEAYPMSLLLLKLVGGGYLLFLGAKSARAVMKGRTPTRFAPDRRPLTDGRAFRRGILVLLTNPKSGLMWAAVASFLFGQGLSAWHVLAFGPMGALSACAIYGTYAWLFSTDAATRGFNRFTKGFEAIFAAAFGTMGASLIWAGLRDARQ